MDKILLITATKIETQAVQEIFAHSLGQPWERKKIRNKIYYYLGKVYGTDIYLVQSEMGTAGRGGALLTVRNAIEAITPAAAIMIGIAFGARPDKQKMGDILVSQQLQIYEPQKVEGRRRIPRGDKVTASTHLLDKFRSGEMDWDGARVHFGLLLSGEKLVADKQFRKNLLVHEPEAIGGDMEGAGLYAAAADGNTDWILVKAICDWGDKRKDDQAQAIAARNAARFAFHVLCQGNLAPDRETKRVELLLDGDFSEFDVTKQDTLVSVMCALLKVKRNGIRVLYVKSGSVVIGLEMSEVAANQLADLARSGDSRVLSLGIQRVQVDDEELVHVITNAANPKRPSGYGRYPIFYRSTETGQVMKWIKAGQCGCLVGLRGVGKSNFARFLLQEETQRHYLGPTYPNFVFVLLDLLALIEQTDWAVYELILDRLLSQARPLIEKNVAEEIALLHREITHHKDPLIAQRAIERSINVLCQQPARRIVFLLDGFDTAFATLAPSPFRYLRAVHDLHKDQLSYLVITNKDLADLRNDLSEVEHFYRLVSRNVCYLGPFTEADAWQMIRHQSAQRSVELRDAEIERLIELSGGHAGLLETILSLWWNIQEKSLLTEAVLNSQPTIQAECRQVWESLSPNEQAALYAIRDDRQIDGETLRRLNRKGLVRRSPSGSIIFFSPLFSTYIHHQDTWAINSVVINRATREVQIAGRRIDHLTELEFETLSYFCEHPGRICTMDDLITNIYSRYEKAEEGVIREAFLALISRLRKKIEPDPKQPRYLITVRGQGYRFVGPDS